MKPISRELQIKINPFESKEPKIFLKFESLKILGLINNRSSKTEYRELSIDENKLENKLFIVWVITSTIFTSVSSKIPPLFF